MHHHEQELTIEGTHVLREADGFLDLGLVAEAREALSRITGEDSDHPGVLAMYQRAAMSEGNWPEAARIAGDYALRFPTDSAGPVMQAYATRRAVSLESARAILVSARWKFPREAVIPYNLACYECQLGNLAQARALLADAFRLDPGYRKIARVDSDLETLWPELV